MSYHWITERLDAEGRKDIDFKLSLPPERQHMQRQRNVEGLLGMMPGGARR